MKICVISGKHTHSEHPVMDADVYRKDPRILSASAYSLLYDANLIAALGGAPQVEEWDDELPEAILTGADLIVTPHAVDDAVEQKLVELAKAGKKIFWIRPSAQALAAATGGKIGIENTLHSHCERWELPGGTFIWPQPVDYDTYVFSSSAKGAWPIGGDWPSIVRAGNVTFGAGGVFHAFNWYWNSPLDTVREDGSFNAFHRMFLGEIAGLVGLAWDDCNAKDNFFIRRDFHAYGFARLLVRDLYRIKGKEADFGTADALIGAAAALVGRAAESQVEDALRPAFEELYRLRCAITDIPVYYAEALHGGILTDEYGYIEIASPQFVVEQMEALMYYARRRKGHFNVDISIATLVHMHKRHPSFTKLFKEGMEEGIFEVCNGSLGQPYPHLFSLESNIRQLETGQKAMQKMYGRGATTLLAQEMQLVPSYPTLLAQAGYEGAIHRIQNKGATVYDESVNQNWLAPDGSMINTVPTHYDDSQQAIAMVHLQWPKLIAKTAETYPIGVYTNLLDNTWNTPFREESNRACYYAPVFGEFLTYSELFKKLPKPETERLYQRDDYMPELQPGTSVMLRDMQKVSNALEGIEKYMALSGREDVNDAIWNAWNKLGEYQNHDNTVCFNVSPRLRYMWPEARGPVRNGPNLYDLTKDETFAALEECLKALGGNDAYFNALDHAREITLLSFPQGAVGLKRAGSIQDATGAQRIRVPAHEIASAPKIAAERAAQDDEKALDNGMLRVTLCEKTGGIASVIDIATGRELLSGAANRLSVGVDGDAKLLSYRRLSIHDVEQFVVKVELTNGDGEFAGWAETAISLPKGEKRIYFTTSFDPYRKNPRPYRPYSHARLTGLYANYALAGEYTDARDCWLHQISGAPDGTRADEFGRGGLACGFAERLREGHMPRACTQSAMGLIMRGGKDSVILHNDGAQIYEMDGSGVCQLLWGECDYETTVSYAMEWTGGDTFEAMLDYQYDLLPVKHAALAPSPSVDGVGAWISSIRRIGGSLYVRVAEIQGAAREVTLRPGAEAKAACFVDLLGNEQGKAALGADGVKIALGANGVRTVRFDL